MEKIEKFFEAGVRSTAQIVAAVGRECERVQPVLPEAV